MRYHGRRVFIGRLCPRLSIRTCIWNVNFQEAPCTGADRRELRCSHEAREASASEVPAVCHWLCFLYWQKKVFSVTSPDNQQNEVSGRLRELLKKKLIAFSSVRALRCLPLPGRLLTVLVPRNFLNSLLTPCFVQLFFRKFMENFIWNQYGERFAIWNTENIKICGWTTKLEAMKNAICSLFLQYLQKIWFLISQGSVTTCLRWGG